MNLEKLYELNPQAIAWDGLDEAIIGMASKTLNNDIIVTYVDEDNEYQTFKIPYSDLEPFDRWGRIEFGPVIVYNSDDIIKIIMTQMGVDNLDNSDGESSTYLDALEHFEFNIDGSYVGEFTPLHIPISEEDY